MKEWVYTLTNGEAIPLFFLENVLIAVCSILGGNYILKKFNISLQGKLQSIEIALTISTVALNTLTNFIGFHLWKLGYIQLRDVENGLTFLLDFLMLFLIMDFLMYWLHRIAHHPWIFKWLHSTHHRFTSPHPVDLFALNPLENLAFGVLWLALLMVLKVGWAAMIFYLTLNVVFGVTGHLGFEPISPERRSTWWYKGFCFSAFHHLHHRENEGNYGFYTTLWDRVFRTYKPY